MSLPGSSNKNIEREKRRSEEAREECISPTKWLTAQNPIGTKDIQRSIISPTRNLGVPSLTCVNFLSDEILPFSIIFFFFEFSSKLISIFEFFFLQIMLSAPAMEMYIQHGTASTFEKEKEALQRKEKGKGLDTKREMGKELLNDNYLAANVPKRSQSINTFSNISEPSNIFCQLLF